MTRRVWIVLAMGLAAGIVLAAMNARPGERSTAERVRPAMGESSDEGVGTLPTPGHEESTGAMAPNRTAVDDANQLAVVPLRPGFPLSSDGVLMVTVVRVDTGRRLPGIDLGVLVDYEKIEDPMLYDEVADLHRTNERGLVAFEVPSGIPMVIYAPGKNRGLAVPGEDHGESGRAWAAVAALDSGEHRSVTLKIPFGLDVTCWLRVLDSAGVALAGARVFESERDSDSFGIDVSRTTSRGVRLGLADQDGLIELPYRSWLESCVLVQAVGYAPAEFAPAPGSATPAKSRTVSLERESTIRVEVSGMTPDKEYAVRIKAWGEETEETEETASESSPCHGLLSWSHVLTDAAPRWNVGVPSKASIVASLANDAGEILRQKHVEFRSPGENQEIHWTLGEGTLVTGQLVDQEGQPIKDHPVLLVYESGVERPPFRVRAVVEDEPWRERRYEARTDGGGRFRFEDVGEGYWWLGPRKSSVDDEEPHDDQGRLRSQESRGHLISNVADRLKVTAGAEQIELELTAHRGLFIVGTVRSVEGWSGNWVWATHADPGLQFGDSTDGNGEFVLGPLLPGEYQVRASQGANARTGPVTANAGDVGLVLSLPPVLGVQGRLVDATTGEGVVGVEGIIWFSIGGDPFTLAQGFAFQRSRFEQYGLREGLYDIAALTDCGLAGLRRSIHLGEGITTEPVRVEMAPGARLSVSYSEALGDYYTVHSQGAIVARGLRQFVRTETVPAGELVVKLWKYHALSAERKITLVAGERREIEFD